MAIALTSRATVYDRYAISRKFTAQETAINVVQGNISLLVSESEITELKNGNKTMYSKLATVELDLKSITLAVSSSEYQDINGVLSAITQARAAITLNSQQIELKVSKDSIVSTINQSAESISINANKINLNGVVTANGNFKILTDGSMEAKNGKFDGSITSIGAKYNVSISEGLQVFEAELSGSRYNSGTIYSTAKKPYPDLAPYTELYVGCYYGGQIMLGRKDSSSDRFYSYLIIDTLRTQFECGVWIDDSTYINGRLITTQGCNIGGSLYVSGTKNRVVKTQSFGTIAQSAYETAEPMFGDMGHGVINEFGECTIFIDQKFAETVSTEYGYYVFITKYKEGDAWISKKDLTTFTVSGTPGMEFDWELKAHQRGYETDRLETVDMAV